ncbi:MAG: extracellular solute-binding protein [Clostridiales bacterium]|jgi:putative aldouronate transport system substrate-binding protein|nr:extracellular solute-binding protein [Clostridiales bacterium]
MKKTLLFVLMLAMLLVTFLPGCGKSEEGTTPSGETPQTPAGEEGKETGDDEEGTLGMSWQRDTSPITFSMFIDHDWYAVDTWGNDDVSKEITKRTGVSLDVIKATDPNQLQVLLAGDELTELVFTSTLVERFHNPDICYRWDELIDEYCPDFWDLVDPITIVNNTADDGHIYTFKTHFSSDEQWEDPRNLPSPGTSGFYVRQDILEQLGNPPLETLDDLVNIFRMVQEKFPDMIVYIPHPQWTPPFLQWMGLFPPGSQYPEGDKVYLGLSQPDLVEYYKFYNMLIREKFTNIEYQTYKPEQFFQIVRSGEVFAAHYNSGLADDTNKVFRDQGIDGWFIPIIEPLKVDGEIKYKLLQWSVGWSSTFITKKCKNPERAILFMQFLRSPEGDQLTQWGIEGVHYTLTEDGLLKRPEGFTELTTQETGIGPWYFQASGLGEGVAVSSGKINNPEFSQGVDLLRAVKPYVIRDFALNFVTPKAETEEMNILVKINELINTSQPGIIGAASEEEAVQKFNEMIENAEKLGLRRLEEYMTEEYQKAKKRYEEFQNK